MPYNESETKAKIREIRNSVEPVLNGFTDELEYYEVSKEHFLWLLEHVEKYQKIKDSWKSDKDKETIHFLRVCKEVIEGIEIPKRIPRS